jgi:hypothetical protein
MRVVHGRFRSSLTDKFWLSGKYSIILNLNWSGVVYCPVRAMKFLLLIEKNLTSNTQNPESDQLHKG